MLHGTENLYLQNSCEVRTIRPTIDHEGLPGGFFLPRGGDGGLTPRALQTQDNDHSSSCLILILSLAAPIGSSSSLLTQTIVVLGPAFSLQPLAFILSEEAKYRERQ